jgi:hypothetical protein
VDEQMQRRWFGVFAQILLFTLVIWIVATAILGIPHGAGHSIESMKWAETISNIVFPLWLGSFVGLIGTLAVAAFGAIRETGSGT